MEQADTKDMMIDNATTLNNLYACYGYLQNGGQDLADYWSIDGGGTDETVRPQEWQTFSSRAQWNAITPSSINTDKTYPWNIWYNAIGYCNQFLKLIEENNPTLNPNDKEQYIAEVKFLKAYYHLDYCKCMVQYLLLISSLVQISLKMKYPVVPILIIVWNI